MSYFCMQIFKQNIDTVLSRSTTFAHRPAAKSMPGPPWRPQNPAWGQRNRYQGPPGGRKTQPEASPGAQNAPRRHPESAGRSPRTPKRLQGAAQKRPKGAPGRPRAPKMRPRDTLRGRFRSVLGSQDRPRLAANRPRLAATRARRPALSLDRFRTDSRSPETPKTYQNLRKNKVFAGSAQGASAGFERLSSSEPRRFGWVRAT